MRKFPKLVIEEAKNLKKFATQEELNKLDFNQLDSDNRFKCIYGSLTGECSNIRSLELIEKCAKRVYHSPGKGGPKDSKKLNGKPSKLENRYVGNYTYFSPIEVFIDRVQNSGDLTMNKKLVEFLKGERKILK